MATGEGEAGATVYAGYGRKIRAARRARDLTQEALAEAVGVRTAAVSDWEREIYRPTAENFRALERALGLAEGALENDTAPAGEQPAGASGGGPRSADYYEGMQYAVQRMLEQILSIQKEATEIHREIVANTVPVPRKHPLGKPAPLGVAGPRRTKGAAKKAAGKKGGRRATG